MSDIRFNQWLHNSGTGGISQDSAGHVGIGTTVPTHINALTHNNSILHVGIVSCNTLNAASKIEGAIDDWIIHQSDTNTKFGFPTTDTFTAHTAGSERLRIDSSGNIGQSVTPSGWASDQAGDFYAYQVGTGIALFGRGSGDEDRGGIAANYYHTGSAQKYIGNGHAGRIYFEDGSIVFSNAAQNSSGAGATMTLNERLRIASDGQTTITAASGDSILHIKRSDTNTTGLTGGINFVASDDHSVANIQVIGDGNNEGAHITFKTTGAAAGDIFNAATVERLRITSDGNVDINGTPPWTVTAGDWRNLSISGQTASSSGFIWLGNGAAATNADFDLARINICNGANIVARVVGSTDTSANDDGRLTFYTKKTGATEAERVRIDSAGTVHISKQDNFNNTAIVQLQDNIIGGIRVSVADETISAAITMPRKGGILCLTCFSSYDTYVQPQPSGLVYVDVGPSKRVDVLDVGTVVASGIVGKTTYTSTVTDCDNGKLTVMVGQPDGTIHLVNRYHDWAGVWTITFL